MKELDWIQDFPAAVTVCDMQGVILDMNREAEQVFAADGGRKLIGKNALDCHPQPARSKMQALLDKQGSNVYTVEKKGKKKMIYQAPWYRDGRFAGLVEISFEMPVNVPNFVRS